MSESKNQSIQDFLNRTASNEPIPGGGSISALNGAIATALAEMLASLTIGKKRYGKIEDEMKQTVDKMGQQRELFFEDIDRDAGAYKTVMDAFKLPKETDEEKAKRSDQIQEATKHAALIPMEIAQRAFDLLADIEYTTRNGNSNAVTDGCISMMTCRTAVLGALLNVRINLGSIKDIDFVKELENRCNTMEVEAIRKEQELYEWVKTTL